MITTQSLSIKPIVQLLVILPVLMVTLENIADFVELRYHYVQAKDWHNLLIRLESVYPVINNETRKNLQLSVF